MRKTIESIRMSSMFKVFNEKYFNNFIVLQEIGFGKRVSTKWLGQTICGVNNPRDTTFIKINPALKGTHYEGVLLHEMIHAYLAQKGVGLSNPHGESFRYMAKTISKKSGFHISIKAPLSSIPKKALQKMNEQIILNSRKRVLRRKSYK